MRREQPNRHGRAADALIASYVRELLDDGQPAEAARLPLPVAASPEVEGAPLQMPPAEAAGPSARAAL